jgi:hypothetical protein
VFRYYSCLMLAAAVVGAVLSIIASGILLLALGLVMLRVGAGGLSAIWMSQHEKRLTPEKIRQGLAEVRECALSLPLEYPGGTGLNANRLAPVVRPNERCSLIPLAEWEARVAWRDEQLINLIHFKEEANP